MRLGVDVGGTFTDAVLVDGERILTAKTPTTPDDQSRGVLEAVAAALEQAGARGQDVSELAHGMTVATNALLEGRTARTALIATAGFTDVLELGRQARPELYRLCAAPPPPLVPRELRFAAPERTGPAGVLHELAEADADALAEHVASCGVEAVAVALLHSYRHPGHERAVAAALRRRAPGVHVSLSHEAVGTVREFERTSTTVIDAALSPLLAGYLAALSRRAVEAGLPAPAIMQSSGGLADVELAARHAAVTVLSGPAGGAAGAALVARAAGAPDALCFDMGGTSCDVCVVDGGRVRETSGRTIGGRPIALPTLDLHTVGAGGGSIAWCDAGGALRVGPRSAGALPGPAAYGRGGREPTVTDANVVLGYLGAGARLAGGVALDGDAAARALGALAERLELDLGECADGVVRVANAEMARALRVMTVERGIDPRRYALLAFGGAGPLHACALADELGIGRVLVARASGVLSALGLVTAPPRRDAQRSVMLAGDRLRDEALGAAVGELAARARRELGDDAAELEAVLDVRYCGQAFELPVAAGEQPSVAQVRERFEALHRERYGHDDPDGEIEVVTVRATATSPRAAPALAAAPADRLERTRRRARFDGAALDAEVLRGEPPAGTKLAGPAIVELPEATAVVAPGWQGEVGATGTIELRRERPG